MECSISPHFPTARHYKTLFPHNLQNYFIQILQNILPNSLWNFSGSTILRHAWANSRNIGSFIASLIDASGVWLWTRDFKISLTWGLVRHSFSSSLRTNNNKKTHNRDIAWLGGTKEVKYLVLVVFQLALYQWWETCKLKAGIHQPDFQME